MFSRKHTTSEDASVDNQPYSTEKKGHWGPKAEGERAFKNFVGTAGG